MRIRRIIGWTAIAVPAIGLAAFGIAYARSTNSCDKPHVTPSHPVRAATYCEYGSVKVLRMVDIEKPAPSDSQVLVKVEAASVNPLDWHFMEGKPYIVRAAGGGLRKPSEIRLGTDYAGVVEAVGKSVTGFKAGDEVFGARTGAFGEYVVVTYTRGIAMKPPKLSFAQAAAIPVAGLTALQAVRDIAKVHAGQRVLINGASGGVGTFMVQIAKAYGAIVTGVCSGKNVELVKSLGADVVIDYTKDDYTKTTAPYDIIIDNVGNRTLSENRHALTATGQYVQIGGGGPNDNKWFGPLPRLAGALIYSKFARQRFAFFVSSTSQADLNALAGFVESGKMTPVVDRTYELTQLPDAITYSEGGHAKGKVIIAVR